MSNEFMQQFTVKKRRDCFRIRPFAMTDDDSLFCCCGRVPRLSLRAKRGNLALSRTCKFAVTRHSSRVMAKRGFTLIEILLAIAITSIVIAGLYSTFFLSRRAVDAVDDSLLRLQESRAVVDVIKREIESALYERDKTYTVFKLDDRDFYGKQASQLRFTSFSPLLPGLAKIAYTVEESDGKLALKKKIASAFAQSVETKSIELMEDIESFTIEAKYADKWVKTWDSEVSNNIPDEIRVSVKIYTKKGDTPFTISDIAYPKYRKTL